MTDHKRRIDKLEKDIGDDKGKPVVVVCWDTDPEPPAPGVIVIEWDDD